jgi:signal transduction histidine kinase
VNNWVNDFEKDQKGFIWIATNDGISRFDGYNFTNFSSENHPLIPINTSFEDIQIHGDLLYAISNEKGVFTINTSNLKVDKIISKGVSSYFRKENLSLIYYTSGTLVLKNKDRIVSKRKFGKSGLYGKVIFSEDKIILDYFFTSVFVLDRNLNILNYSILNDKANGIALMEHKSLGTLFCTSKGNFKLQGNSFVPMGKQSNLNEFSFFNFTSDGKPFFVKNFKEPVMPFYKGNYVFSFDKIQNTEVRTIFHLGKDYWLIGTNQGIYKLNLGKRFNSQIQDAFFEDDQIRVRRKIIEFQEKLYLLGFPGIVEFDLKNNSQKFITQTKRELTNYDAILIDNHILATSEGKGVWNFDLKTNSLSKIKTKFIPEDAFFNCVKQKEKNQLLFGGKGELVFFDYLSKESFRLNFSDQIDVYDIEFLGKSKEIILATNKGLFSFLLASSDLANRSVQIKLTKRAKLDLNIKDILVSHDKRSLYVASDNGLFKLGIDLKKIERRYLKPNEISNSKVTGILEDKQGRIWASTYSGLTCFDSRLNMRYFISDKHGLCNSEFNYKSFERLADGRLIFGGLYGYDIIDPKSFDFNSSPTKIIFSGYRTEKEGERQQFEHKKGSNIEFNTSEENLLLYFSTTDFNNAEMYSFEYKINDGEWLQLTNNNVLSISDLKGGNNKLHIRLKDSFSNICDVKEYAINAKIPFYYELYFYIFISILIATLSFLAVYYFNQMRRVEVETKKRISMDLHDETGTILTRVLLMSKSESTIVKNLDVFQSSLKEALFSLRTFMDSLSGKKSYLSDLIIELKEFMSISFRGTNISAQLSSEKIENIWLSAELYRDIKLCMYEAIQNTLKHSDSSKFDVRIYQKKSCLFIEISDNGETNFSLEEVEEKGNGFRNFQKRTKRHNGSVKIELKGEKKSVHLFFEFPLK